MADEDYDRRGRDENEEEEWLDPEDTDIMLNGPKTIFVGGFSKYKTINEALEAVMTSNDRIIVLDSFDGDVVIDATRYAGVTIVGATSENTIPPKPLRTEEEKEEEEQEMNLLNDEIEDEEELDEYGDPKEKPRPPKEDTTKGNINIFGKLIFTYSEPSVMTTLPTGFPVVDEDDEDHNDDDDNAEDDKDNTTTLSVTKNGNDGRDDNTSGTGDRKKEGESHNANNVIILSLHNLTFTRGVEMESLTCAIIDDCAFGTRVYQSDIITTVKVNALSNGVFTRCRFYGGSKASVYCCPSSRCKFISCDIMGAILEEEDKKLKVEFQKKPRGYVAPPPPRPVPPVTVTSATGILTDDSNCTFEDLDISNFGIGIYCIGINKDLSIKQSRVKLIQTVGVLCVEGYEGKFHEVVVSLCGRECAVFASGHPTVRNCVFLGDVRLKKECVSTGMTDNIVAMSNSKVINEDDRFNIKGFRRLVIDPTIKKIRNL